MWCALAACSRHIRPVRPLLYGAKPLSDKQSESQNVANNDETGADAEVQRELPAAAQRALAEAEARRKAAQDAQPDQGGESSSQQEKELGGPKGPEPTRFGDWEKGGIISDF